MALRLRQALLAGLVASLLAATLGGFRALEAEDPDRSAGVAQPPSAPSPAEEPPLEADPLGPNGACYVCHTTFVKEELAKVHLVEKIACVKCHGLSDKHANDENVGATKPDIMFKRHEVDASCQKCHDTHDVPATQVIARFVERGLSAKNVVICTDCHGTHRIDRSASP
jgi:hypothetical protein